MFSEWSCPQSQPVTMEARTFWVLVVVVLALGSSSSTGQYVGLCEYRSDPFPLGGREEEGLGGRVGIQDKGTGHGRARLGAFCGLEESDKAP